MEIGTHFHSASLIAKIVAFDNPHVIVEKHIHSQCITFWFEFWAVDIRGPYSFGNEAYQNLNVAGD